MSVITEVVKVRPQAFAPYCGKIVAELDSGGFLTRT